MFESANRIEVLIGAGNVDSPLVELISASPHLSVTGVTTSSGDLIDLAARRHPNVILLHLATAGPTAERTIGTLRRTAPLSRIVACLDGASDESLRRVQGFGAHAVFDADDAQVSAVSAIRSTVATLHGASSAAASA
jgi:DNA-binding NarL/FixJ family response regulator